MQTADKRPKLFDSGEGRVSFWAARRACYRHLTAWRVAWATCSTRACHARCHANFCIKIFLENAPFRVNHIQLELLGFDIYSACPSTSMQIGSRSRRAKI